MPHPLPHWFLLGAGNMGTLAAWDLTRAGHRVSVLRDTTEPVLHKTLRLPDEAPNVALTLPVMRPDALTAPVRHLLVAVKTPYSQSALKPLQRWLTDETLVLRLQNGLGALDGLLPEHGMLLEAVSTSAVKGQHPVHEIVAENTTWLGGSPFPPAWFDALTHHWPDLRWREDMREPQWQKLVVNAVINPLTALHDVPNGAICTDPALRAQAEVLTREADQVLQSLNPHWPGNSLDNVLAVATATAGNTSSMRADRQRGAPTEIDAINGWLVKQADMLGLAVPENSKLVQAMQSTLA